MTQHQLPWMLASHAVQVTLLAAFVWSTTKLLAKNRPHLAHSLWILVLLKCLMPPAWSSPTSIFSWLGNTVSSRTLASLEPDEIRQSESLKANGSSGNKGSSILRLSFSTIGSDNGTSTSRHSLDKRSELTPRQQESGKGEWPNGLHVVLAVIAVGFTAGLLTTIIRVKMFLRSAYASGHRHDEALEMAVIQLCRRLGIRQRVEVHVTGTPIGPVVVGLFRPTLLLPELILADREPVQLEPLLAHELIHIRRGDLWWALLQTTATCLWWFHPLIHLANRMATREAESSCDEETVMCLGCSPSKYARSILEILERKHQLQIAPTLPGVRPVDVTLNRMERIMKLGQGGHHRTPLWIWGLLVCACALVLPSATWSVAQDNPRNENDKRVEVTQQVPQGPSSKSDEFQNAQWEVSDLLGALKSCGYKQEQAKAYLLNQLPRREEKDRRNITMDLGTQEQPLVNLPKLVFNDQTLHLFDLKSRVDQFREKLTELRQTGFPQITCEVSLISLSPDDFKKLSEQWSGFQVERVVSASAIQSRSNLLNTLLDGQAASITETKDSLKLTYGVVVNDTKSIPEEQGEHSDLRNLRVALLSDLEAKFLLSAPWANCLIAHKLVVLSGQSASVESRIYKADIHESKTDVVEEQKIDILPAIANLDSIDMSLGFEIIRTPTKEAFALKPPSKDVTQHVVKQKVRGAQTFALGGIATQTDGKESVLVICLTPTIGVLNPSNRVNYESAPLSIGTRELHPLKILGPLTSVNSAITDFTPSDDEIIHAIEKQHLKSDMTPQATKRRNQKPSIGLRKITKSVEQARFVPLIGNAELHHNIYECILQDLESGQIETQFIDQYHFHLID